MTEAWDKRDGESANAYRAFCDYRDMGTARSLRSLHEQYLKQTSNKRITKSRPTLNTWSARNDWQNRVTAWDNHLLTANTTSQENAVQELLDGELRDSKIQLDKWHDAYEATTLLQRTKTKVDSHGNTITYVGLNNAELHDMAKWRNEIAKQYRRALHLPERVTEKHIDHTTKGKELSALTDKTDDELDAIIAEGDNL